MTTISPGQFAFGPFRLDTKEHSLTRHGDQLPLTPKSFDLLCLLVCHAGRLVDKERIMQTLWPDSFVEEANLSNLIAALRRQLGDSSAQPIYIQTVPKLGYRFVARVEEVRCESKPTAGQEQPQRQPTAIRFIAFPFRANGPVTEVEHLGFGLSDEISSVLADLNAFIVRSVQVAMRFDPIHWDPARVAEQAEVDVILSGTYSQHGPQLQLLTHLMEARSGALLWSKQWRIERDEAFRLPQAVVQMIVRTLLRGDKYHHTDRVASDATFDLYLRANLLTMNRTPENMALARDLYLACIEKDPRYAPAWANLGRCYRFLDKFAPRPGHYRNAAISAFERAFALDPDLGIAHIFYTALQVESGAAGDAVVRLLKRSTRHSNDPQLFSALVHACRYCGLLDVSVAAHKRALQLDPNVRTSVAHTYFAQGDYERALFWYGAEAGLYLDALSLACMNRKKEALALLWSRRDKFHLMPVQMESLQAYLEGDHDRCISVLKETASGAKDPEMVFYASRQAAIVGAIDLANTLLSESIGRGYFSSHAMAHDPWLQSLRDTGEFRSMVERARHSEAKARRSFHETGGDDLLLAR